MELIHLLSLVADFVDHDIYRKNEAYMSAVYAYTRDTLRFLSEPEINIEWDHQMLRYYFCKFLEKYYNHIVISSSENESADRYSPLNIRLSLFKLCEDWCGHGNLAAATRDRESKMMVAILDQIKDIKERANAATAMEEQRQALEMAALQAMASLCKGAIVNPRNPNSSFDLRSLVAWIDSLFANPDEKFHKIGREALEGLLTYNRKNAHLVSDIINQCYMGSPESEITRGYFTSLVDIFAKPSACTVTTNSLTVGDSYPLHSTPHRLFCLALYKAGDPSASIRKGAVSLLHFLEKLVFNPNEQKNSTSEFLEQTVYEASAIMSTLPIIYKYAQAMMSSRLAREHSEMTYEILSEMVFRIDMIVNSEDDGNLSGIRDILICMVPWVNNIELTFVEQELKMAGEVETVRHEDTSSLIGWRYPPLRHSSSGTSQTILNNFFYLTIRYGDQYIAEIENLWILLVENPNIDPKRSYEKDLIHEKNVNMIIEYLLQVGAMRRNPKLVNYAKKIVVYLSRTSVCSVVILSLISRISPKTLVPASIGTNASNNADYVDEYINAKIGQSKSKLRADLSERHLYLADLDEVIPELPKRPAFSKGQLACVFLVDLAIEVPTTSIMPHLPLLLHVIFVQLDHFISLICEQNRSLLINLIQAIIPRDIAHELIDQILITLTEREGKRMWAYEDITRKHRGIESARQISELVKQVTELFSFVDPSFAQAWGEIALIWSTSCPVRHVACRSLQIQRSLAPAFTRQMLGDLLHRLSNTIADSTEVLFPQIFWASIACLHSPVEGEFLEATRLIYKYLSIVSVIDDSVRINLFNNMPTRWKGEFIGIQPMLLRGLTSSKCEREVLALINFLLPLVDDAFVDTNPTSRLLFSILSNLPRFLQGFEKDPGCDGGADVGMTLPPTLEIALQLSKLCSRSNEDSLSRIFLSYSKRKFRSRDDFGRYRTGIIHFNQSFKVHQIVMSIRQTFFPVYKMKTLLFLTDLLASPIIFYRRKALKLLKHFFPSFTSTKNNEEDIGEELMAPLLNILHTEIGAEALEVLDETLKVSHLQEETNLRLVLGSKSIQKMTKDVSSSILSNSKNVMNGFEISGWKMIEFGSASKISRINMLSVASISTGKKSKSTGKYIKTKSSYAEEYEAIVNDENLTKNLLEEIEELEEFFFSKELTISLSAENHSKITVLKANHQHNSLPRNDEKTYRLSLHKRNASADTSINSYQSRNPSINSISSDPLYSSDALGNYSNCLGTPQRSHRTFSEMSQNLVSDNSISLSQYISGSSFTHTLLGLPNVSIHVSFRLKTLHENVMKDSDFTDCLLSDLIGTLNLESSNKISVAEVVPDDGMALVSVKFKTSDIYTDVAQGQVLVSVISSMDSPSSTAAQTKLKHGIVTFNIDSKKTPALFIEQNGIKIPLSSTVLKNDTGIIKESFVLEKAELNFLVLKSSLPLFVHFYQDWVFIIGNHLKTTSEVCEDQEFSLQCAYENILLLACENNDVGPPIFPFSFSGEKSDEGLLFELKKDKKFDNHMKKTVQLLNKHISAYFENRALFLSFIKDVTSIPKKIIELQETFENAKKENTEIYQTEKSKIGAIMRLMEI